MDPTNYDTWREYLAALLADGEDFDTAITMAADAFGLDDADVQEHAIGLLLSETGAA